MIALIAVLVLVGWERTRELRRRVLVTKTSYRLYALRDELRDYAIENPVAARSWLFPYLDSTISKAICALEQLSVWRLLTIIITSDRQKLFDHHSQLFAELRKGDNHFYKEVYSKLMTALGEFVIQRQLGWCRLLAISAITSASLVNSYRRFKKRTLILTLESLNNTEVFARSDEIAMEPVGV